MAKDVYLAGRPLRTFGARLRTDYEIAPEAPTQSLQVWPGDSCFQLLDDQPGLLSLTLPLDFLGEDRGEIAGHMAQLRGLLRGICEVDLGDGFLYRCCLTGVSGEEWAGECLCSQILALKGMRHKEEITVSGSAPLTVFNPGTWPRTACTLTLKALNCSGSVTIALRQDGKDYLKWTLNGMSGALTGGDLILSGQDKRNLYRGGNLPQGIMDWAEYPYLRPGTVSLEVTGLEDPQAEITFEPTYL